MDFADPSDPSNDDLGVTQELQIDRVCLRFEQQLQAGNQPLIEQSLSGTKEPLRSNLLRQLLLLELEHRDRCESAMSVEEYLRRFPSDHAVIYSVFAEHARLADPPETEVRDSQPQERLSPESDSASSGSSHHGRFLPGTKLAGRYRIVSLLGKGGMGEVYRADDLKLGHSVALKFLPEELASDPRRLEYFYNEVRLSRQISHPNVCRVYDIAEVDGQHFLSMEYVDGEDLKGLLRRVGRFPQERGIQIARQLCAGLAAAHDRGVLHRDLKPANVMIDGRGQVRITDFGLATVVGEAEGGESFVGTPAYMAPEQLQRAKTSVQSDIYSLGLVLYEVFTGEAAHPSGSRTGGQNEPDDSSSPSSPSDVVSEIEPSVERTIMRCLDSSPEQRPRSVAEVAAALPGGDPLAAALAAGETPSPEMVAAAGEAGWLSPPVACACLAGVAVGLVLVILLAQRFFLVNRLPLDLPPAALEVEAKEILRQLEYTDPPADTAYGFEAIPAELGYREGRLRRQDVEARRELIKSLKTARWPGIRFWYRESPKHMFADHFWFNANLVGRARVYVSTPPWNVAGMVGVRLDPRQGHLRWFQAVPPEETIRTSDKETMAPKWSEWFTERHLGFNLNDLSPAAWRRTPPDAFDCLFAWEGTWPDSDEPLYVEAAAYRGRPVYFEVLHPSDIEAADDSSGNGEYPPSYGIDGSPLEVVFLVLAAALAWWNLRTGRGDTRGAFRTGLYFLVMELIIWLVQASHVGGVKEARVFTLGLAFAAVVAVRMWFFYTATEPFIRRFWPELLISWARLLDGQFRNPRIGRDLLVGSLFGMLWATFALATEWLGVSGGSGGPWPVTLLGPFALAGAVLWTHMLAVGNSLAALVMLLLLRVCLRSQRMAAIGFVGLIVLIGLEKTQGAGFWLLIGVNAALYAWLLIRLGFLSTIVAVTTVSVLEILPITTDTDAFHFGNGMLGVALVAAIALYGFYTSLGGRPVLGYAMSSSK